MNFDSNLIIADYRLLPYQSTMIVDTITSLGFFRLSNAQKSNHFFLTTWLYERIWRKKALKFISGGLAGFEDELKWLSDYAQKLPENSLVIDLACSVGLYGRIIQDSRPDAKVIFQDFSLPMLKECVSVNKNPDNSMFVRSFCETEIVSPESVDSVVCGGSWNELTQIPESLNQIYQCLKPGGSTAWMGVFIPESPNGNKKSSRLSGIHTESLDIIEHTFQTTGFTILDLATKANIFFLIATKS